MRSRHRSRALVGRLFAVAAAIGIFVVVRDRLIARNRDRLGPPPLDPATSTA
jgi:hypothetical protein